MAYDYRLVSSAGNTLHGYPVSMIWYDVGHEILNALAENLLNRQRNRPHGTTIMELKYISKTNDLYRGTGPSHWCSCEEGKQSNVERICGTVEFYAGTERSERMMGVMNRDKKTTWHVGKWGESEVKGLTERIRVDSRRQLKHTNRSDLLFCAWYIYGHWNWSSGDAVRRL